MQCGCVLMVAANLVREPIARCQQRNQFNTVGGGNVTITGCAAGSITAHILPFVIPSSIEGQPVAAIADGAFYDLLPDLTQYHVQITSVAILTA